MNSFRLSSIGPVKPFKFSGSDDSEISLEDLLGVPKLDMATELDIRMQSSGILPIFKYFHTIQWIKKEEETVSKVSLSDEEAESIEKILLKKEIMAAYLKAYADFLKNDNAAVLLSEQSENKFEGRTKPMVNFYGVGWKRNKPDLFWIEGPVIFKRRKIVDLDELVCSCLCRWTKTGNEGFFSIIRSFIETLYDTGIVDSNGIGNDKIKL